MSTYFKNDSQDDDSNNFGSKLQKLYIYMQTFNDKIQFYKNERWIAAGVMTLFFLIRLIWTGGYHAVTYCLGIHLLNAFIGFISPLEDPEEEGYKESESGSFLPQKESEEFRPFQRKVKEFQFWNVIFWGFFISSVLTFNEAFNVPVYWPLLLVYFVLIFFLTMRKQINHMIKYKYLPWDAGKAKYGVNMQTSK